MYGLLKTLARPVYRGLVKTPLMQAILRREMAGLGLSSWNALLFEDFIQSPYGEAYGLSPATRQDLLAQFQRNVSHITSGTSVAVHVLLAREILSIPPEQEGDVVECGVWKGASSASLSLVCALVGRRLKVCDSFAGLPDEGMQRHVGLHTGVYGYYKEGMFEGRIDEVRSNIERYGALEVCDFIEGFFDRSLAQLPGPIVFAFLDVDLRSSMEDCLKAIWPKLVEEGMLYSDDAGDLEVVQVYFDRAWWREALGCDAPGFVGSGCGLPLSPSFSSLGYAKKQGAFREEAWKKASFLHYPDQD